MMKTNDMFLTTNKLDRRMRELERFRFVNMISIAPMTAMDGALDADAVYHSMPDTVEGRQIEMNDEFIGRDRYVWLRKSVVLPMPVEGCEVYGLFDFGRTGAGNNSGFEALLYVDGHPYQGVDTNHQDVNFQALAGKTVTLTFLLWTGLEGGGPRHELRHRFEQADIGYLHKATDEFYYLAKAIVKTIRLLDESEPNKYALTRALDRAFDRIDWDVDCFHGTVGEALAGLRAALGQMEKNTPVTVSVVGHTHIDVAWLWRLKHTREKCMRSFATVLKLMDEFDEYIFLQAQPQLYQYIQKDCPELYAKIKARAAEGRWEADGGMWLEADCNIPSGEALTRQFLYGIRFIQKEFNHKCEYLWLPDVFGYSWSLPQILKGVGIDTFMTTKISWNQFNAMPHDLFLWRGIDGSEVMTYFITTPEVGRTSEDPYATYNGMISPRSVLGSWEKFHDKNVSCETLVSYGFGDGGGGVNRNMLKMRRAMDLLPGLPNVKPSRAGSFFGRLHQTMKTTDQPVATWDGELYLEYHRGTYTSQAWNKRMNRRLEFMLTECEWLCAMAKLAGGRYPQDTLTESWQTVLRNQFHDIIPGSSIGEVYQDCRREYACVTSNLRDIREDALAALTKPEANAWTVWHFGSFPRRDIVFVRETRKGVFRNTDGQVLETQKEADGYWIKVTLPALAAATIRFEEAANQAPACVPFRVEMAQSRIETPFYQAVWDERGHLIRLFDRGNDREVLAKGAQANVLEVYEDKPLDNDNWDVDGFHLLKHEEAALSKAPELMECGALRAVIRFTYAYRSSTFVQHMIFYAHSRRIDFDTQANWQETHRLLKAAFPVAIRATKATYDIQYGHVERPTHFNTSWDYARFEVVAHKWADLSEEGYGVSLLNDCKYGHSAHNNVLRITLLKSGKYPDREADMGEHTFTYALLPHAGTAVQGDTLEEAVKLNLPVHACHDIACGPIPTLRTASRHVMIDAFKKAEDDDCLIVRMHECRGGSAKAELSFGFRMKAYAPCNLLEEEIGERVNAPVIHTTLHPFEIQTFRIWTK